MSLLEMLGSLPADPAGAIVECMLADRVPHHTRKAMLAAFVRINANLAATGIAFSPVRTMPEPEFPESLPESAVDGDSEMESLAAGLNIQKYTGDNPVRGALQAWAQEEGIDNSYLELALTLLAGGARPWHELQAVLHGRRGNLLELAADIENLDTHFAAGIILDIRLRYQGSRAGDHLDRRRARRHPAHHGMRYGRPNDWHRGLARNLSETGVQVWSASATVPQNTNRIALFDLLVGQDLILGGKIVWQTNYSDHADKHSSTFGFHFDKPLPRPPEQFIGAPSEVSA